MLSVFDAKHLADFATATMFQKGKAQVLAHPTLYADVERVYLKVGDEILAAAGAGDYELNTAVHGLYITKAVNVYRASEDPVPTDVMQAVKEKLEVGGFTVKYAHYAHEKCDEDTVFFGLVISWSIE